MTPGKFIFENLWNKQKDDFGVGIYNVDGCCLQESNIKEAVDIKLQKIIASEFLNITEIVFSSISNERMLFMHIGENSFRHWTLTLKELSIHFDQSL